MGCVSMRNLDQAALENPIPLSLFVFLVRLNDSESTPPPTWGGFWRGAYVPKSTLDQDALEGPIPLSFYLFVWYDLITPNQTPTLWGGFGGGGVMCP